MLNDATKQITHKSAIARSFSRAAKTYDQVALLQQEIGNRLLERLDFIKFNPQTILDLGGGTGFFNKALLEKYPQANIIFCDIAEGMVQYAKEMNSPLKNNKNLNGETSAPNSVTDNPVTYICADGDFLPIQNQSIDFVFSNCALQWFPDLSFVFQEIQRILKPSGLLLFSTFGIDTLMELRASFAQIDLHPHVNTFFDMHDIGDQLLEQGFQDPVMDMEKIILTYQNIKGLLLDLKLTGAHTVVSKIIQAELTGFTESRGLTGLSPKTTFKRLAEYYEHYRQPDGLLPATFEIVYGLAWGDASIDNGCDTTSCKKIPATIINI